MQLTVRAMSLAALMVHCGQWTPAPVEPEPPANSAPIVDASARLLAVYEYRFKDVDQHARQLVWNEIARFLWKRMGRPRRVLDPAGGRGEFVNAVPADERWLVDVVDYPERQTDPAVRIVIGDLFEIELPPAYFDGVFASNLLEHFHSPEEVAGVPRPHARDAGARAGCSRSWARTSSTARATTSTAPTTCSRSRTFRCRSSCSRRATRSSRSSRGSCRSRSGAGCRRRPRSTRLYLRMPALWPLQGKQFLILATLEPGVTRHRLPNLSGR